MPKEKVSKKLVKKKSHKKRNIDYDEKRKKKNYEEREDEEFDKPNVRDDEHEESFNDEIIMSEPPSDDETIEKDDLDEATEILWDEDRRINNHSPDRKKHSKSSSRKTHHSKSHKKPDEIDIDLIEESTTEEGFSEKLKKSQYSTSSSHSMYGNESYGKLYTNSSSESSHSITPQKSEKSRKSKTSRKSLKSKKSQKSKKSKESEKSKSSRSVKKKPIKEREKTSKTSSFEKRMKKMELSIRQVINGLNNSTTPPLNRSDNCIKASRMKLRPHQIAVVDHLMNHRGLIAIHMTGSGKTLTAVTASQCVLSNFPNSIVYVITPKSLIERFKEEMIKYGLFQDQIDDKSKYIFYTHQKFFMDHDKLSDEELKKRFSNAFIIIDEAQNLRTEVHHKHGITSDDIIESDEEEDVEGSIAHSIIRACRFSFKILLLSATPMMNKFYDIENLLSMLYGKEPFNQEEFSFIANNEQLMDKYFHCCLSFYHESKVGFPNVVIQDVIFVMDPVFYKEYMRIENNEQSTIAKKLFGGSSDLKTFYNGVRRAANALGSTFSPKVEWIIKKIKEGEKTLVFSHWKMAGLRLVAERLKQEHIPFDYIDGTRSTSQRKHAVRSFNTGKVKVLLISKAGGEGLDLEETRNVIVCDPGWNDASIQQVMGRAIRYHSHIKLPPDQQLVHVYQLFMDKPKGAGGLQSIDIFLRDLAIEKKKKIKKMMNRLSKYDIVKNKC